MYANVCIYIPVHSLSWCSSNAVLFVEVGTISLATQGSPSRFSWWSEFQGVSCLLLPSTRIPSVCYRWICRFSTWVLASNSGEPHACKGNVYQLSYLPSPTNNNNNNNASEENPFLLHSPTPVSFRALLLVNCCVLFKK